MPIIKSAVKRMRQTAKRRERNVGIKKDIKGAVKAFVAEPSAKAFQKHKANLTKPLKKVLSRKTQPLAVKPLLLLLRKKLV